MIPFRIISGALLTALVILALTPVCQAENDALKKECETKARKAAALINELGPEAAFVKISNPSGEFVGKRSHVFAINIEDGKLLAHKAAQFVGFNMHNYEDADKKNIYSVILKRAQAEDSGWITYNSVGVGPEKREKPAIKQMHFHRVPGKDMILCSGYWDE